MVLVLLISGDVVIRISSVPSELVFFFGRNIDVLRGKKFGHFTTEKPFLTSLEWYNFLQFIFFYENEDFFINPFYKLALKFRFFCFIFVKGLTLQIKFLSIHLSFKAFYNLNFKTDLA